MKKTILTDKAPMPIGPYNQAVIYNNTLYLSGQVAITPPNGELVIDNIEDETHRVLQNIGALLEAGGSSFEQCIKCSVFVKDMHQFARINAVYAQYFKPETAPARELVEVSNLPKFVNIEISVIAMVPKKTKK
jgi:2-iminobutanoate/2-iminopropanoate deaminase